jgi:hypothetical protein
MVIACQAIPLCGRRWCQPGVQQVCLGTAALSGDTPSGGAPIRNQEVVNLIPRRVVAQQCVLSRTCPESPLAQQTGPARNPRVCPPEDRHVSLCAC